MKKETMRTALGTVEHIAKILMAHRTAMNGRYFYQTMQKLLNRMAEIDGKTPEWISTKDRLPQPHLDVLVTDGRIMAVDFLLSCDITAHIDPNKGVTGIEIGPNQEEEEPMWDGDNDYRGPITYWMPLPDYPDMSAEHAPIYREEAPE